MANTVLNPTIIAKAAVRILDNELVMAQRVYRAYENEFDKKYNGYDLGDTLTIRRPTDFTVRDGRTASIQDVVEGKTTIVINKQKGVDFQFTSQELTLNISELADRVIRPAMVQVANQIDRDLAALYADVWNWVGTPGSTVDAFADFAKAPERLDLGAVPDERCAVLSPSDHWALAGSQTALYMQNVAEQAYRKGRIGDIGGVDTYMTQNIATLTTGSRTNATPLIMGATQTTTWALSKDTGTMSLITKGWVASSTIAAGEVFTIANVFAVNPVTKATLPHLQPFVVKVAATANATTTLGTTLTISPPIIATGSFQTVSVDPADNATITIFGTASTGYAQNMVFHKNAFALAIVPMIKPPGAVDVARESYKGISVRLVPYYSGSNDISSYRLDVLYGVKSVDPRLATRLSGT